MFQTTNQYMSRMSEYLYAMVGITRSIRSRCGHVYLPTLCFKFKSKGGTKLEWSVTKSCCWSSCRSSLS